MIEIKGKYNTAKVFTDLIDDATIGQLVSLCNQTFTEGSKIRIMTDCHSGKGCVIGTTMTIKDKIVPNLVGVDIGCGVSVTEIGKPLGETDLATIDNIIREKIPAGRDVHSQAKETFPLDAMTISKEQTDC